MKDLQHGIKVVTLFKIQYIIQKFKSSNDICIRKDKSSGGK